ncbi:FAD-linked oxidoreductase family [Alloactinosynnema sp. L-07]|uniref:FAD-binding protein n=1 Tax=Alloactinosynnema sp. L-07 TaxID=1653480 RepID=UPI00065EFC91|nr:FAD-binding protein [Alloactinosynnema sp. L-07]CRK59443.1 FAD-linked oxidoreductase family [Alloactinosynnema sp. L-07]
MSEDSVFGPATISAGDPRYESMLCGTNHRFAGKPAYVRVVATAQQVVAAVGEAVAAGARVQVRSGGHGFEDFTSADVDALIDMSEMTSVGYDADMRAFAIEPGATLRHVYRVLYKGWGVTIPAGEGAEVGFGGHVTGGGYGPLSRRFGAVVDYLYAVEVVVVDADGTARLLVATREADDPNRDLWWAHTGGGGGTFGVVTKFWVRAPGTPSDDPAELLPKAPTSWRQGFAMWPWPSLSDEASVRLIRNFGAWFEANSAPDSPYAAMTGFLHGSHRDAHGLMVGAAVDDDVPDAQALVDGFFAAVSEGVGVDPVFLAQQVKPWLYVSTYPGWGDPGSQDARRIKIKAAMHREGFDERQIAAIRAHLDQPDPVHTQVILIGYGGKVNAADPADCATPHRDSVFKATYLAAWADPADDERTIGGLRSLYADIYADTGGVPGVDGRTDGSYINYPDADLADPEQNTSGVPWQTLYFKDNYPRLQEVKRRYDPRDVFRHRLSVRLPD